MTSYPVITTNNSNIIVNSHLFSPLPSTSTASLSPKNFTSSEPRPVMSCNPPTKKLKIPAPELPSELGKYISRDVALLSKLGWKKFVQQRRRRGDFASLNIQHPAKRLLKHIKTHGAPVQLSSKPWSQPKLAKAIRRGPHRSCQEYINFLEEEFIDMIKKEQWIILPYSTAKSLPGLRLSPPGVVPQRDRRPRWICDYSWYGVNDDTLPLAPLDSMQFGHALERILREILLADPKLGPIYMLKLDISDGFYRVNLAPGDIPKLGVVFPTRPGHEPLVALPLVLPMGWKNSPPFFSAVTETAADLANANLRQNISPQPHPLEPHAALHDTLPLPPATTNHSSQTSSTMPHSSHNTNTHSTDTYSVPTVPIQIPTIPNPSPPSPTPCIKIPTHRDPCLPSLQHPVKYVDVFVDDFIGLCQGHHNKSHVRQTLLHAVDAVFRPTDFHDGPYRREPVSLKKLKKGDVSWNTIKLVLGWIINTTTMTIHLPPHRVERLGQILADIPPSQKRLSVKKWHRVLGELRSMALALPGSRNLFSTMQKALSLKKKTRIALHKSVHSSLDDFRWLHHDIAHRPTRIAELIPLNPCAIGYHDAAGCGAGGVWFANPELVPRSQNPSSQPLLWRLQWPDDITASLISDNNPQGTITNSDLELAGGLLHLDAIAHHFDVRERTLLSKTDNLATMFWQRKGSATTTDAPAHLLRLFGIHQRFHRYVPRHDYIPGLSNPMADDASRLFDLSNTNFLSHFNSKYPQSKSYKLVTPTLPMVSSVISALRKKRCNVESLLADPPPPAHTGTNGTSSPLTWASTPFSKPSKTKYQSYKSSSDAFAPEDLLPSNVRSSLGQLKTTYGQLPRRTLQWGPRTLASTPQATSTSDSPECSSPTPKRTHHQTESNQFQSQLSDASW
jgi:hypothetical protein